MNWVPVPADLADEHHPNVRWIPMPKALNQAISGYLDELLATHFGCPACDHSPHPSAARLEELNEMAYNDYLRTPEWQRTRRAKLEQVGNRCRRCGADRKLHVHHLTYDHVGHEWLDELVVLCSWCHSDTHGERDQQRRRKRRR